MTAEIRFSGSGGQGLQLVARILAEALSRSGRTVSLSQSYEPTSRGGVSRADLVVGDETPEFPLVTALDHLVILDDIAAETSRAITTPATRIVTDAARVTRSVPGEAPVQALPFAAEARALGNDRVANIIALGTLVAAGGLCDRAVLEDVIAESVPAKVLDVNLEAVAAGYRLAEGLEAAAPAAS